MKIEQSQEDFQNLLAEQLDFLTASCKAFDDDRRDGEVKRMAVVARVLLHDTKLSQSLLSHMQNKAMLFCDTSLPYEEGAHSKGFSTLSVLKITKFFGQSTVPMFDAEYHPATWRPFNEWWNGLAIVTDDGRRHTRRDVVLALANKAGGAHVDKEIDELYHKARDVGSLGLMIANDAGAGLPLDSVVFPVMRQITHEILKTLVTGYEKKHPASKYVNYISMPQFFIEEIDPNSPKA